MEKNNNDKKNRLDWDEYFLGIMDAVSKRGTCDRGYAASVIVKDRRILATGYAGAPSGLPHCDELGHEISEVLNEDGTTSKHCIRTTHAEMNAVAQAAKFGTVIDGSTLYINMEPCYVCAKVLINAGIKRIVCRKLYHRAGRSREVLKQTSIPLEVIESVVESYGKKQ